VPLLHFVPYLYSEYSTGISTNTNGLTLCTPDETTRDVANSLEVLYLTLVIMLPAYITIRLHNFVHLLFDLLLTRDEAVKTKTTWMHTTGTVVLLQLDAHYRYCSFVAVTSLSTSLSRSSGSQRPRHMCRISRIRPKRKDDCKKIVLF
jgi:hypothetical protein